MHISQTKTLAILLTIATQTVFAQGPPPGKTPPLSFDVGITYARERAELAPSNCNCFWLQGGGLDAALTIWKGLGIAGTVTGDHLANYSSGIDINKISYLAGVRYTLANRLGRKSSGGERMKFFAQALFGEAHAFNGTFPSASGLKSSANSFALQTGGGMNFFLTRRLGVRVFEADYVRTSLSNGFSNRQHDLRLAFGLALRF